MNFARPTFSHMPMPTKVRIASTAKSLALAAQLSFAEGQKPPKNLWQPGRRLICDLSAATAQLRFLSNADARSEKSSKISKPRPKQTIYTGVE